MLELLLGMSLVVVVLLAVFQLFPLGDRSVGLADRTTHASLIARRVMNEQMGKKYEELVNTSGEETITAHTKRRGSELSTTFTYDVQVSDSEVPKVKDIMVTVAWKVGSDDRSRESQVRLFSSKGELW